MHFLIRVLGVFLSFKLIVNDCERTTRAKRRFKQLIRDS
jgi:hypothetical protein